MQLRTAVLVTLVAGCYAPAANPGAPCGPGDTCPSDQECRAGTCVLPGTPDDAGPLDTATGTPDMADAAALDAYVSVPWGTPVLVPGLDVPGEAESDPSLSQDGLRIVFATNPATNNELYMGTRVSTGDAFTLTLLTTVNSTANDKSPELSADGNTLYFTSNRSGSFEVYRSTFVNDAWGAPVLQTDLSDAARNEADLAISADGLTALVSDDIGSNRFLLHTRASTAQPFGAGVVQPALQVTTDIAAPSITNDAQLVFLHAGGVRDLYVARRLTDGTFETPVVITELTTGAREAAPFINQAATLLLFERSGAIYQSMR